MGNLVRNKHLLEEHYATFWSSAPNEALAAQLAPDFVDHAMPAGTVRCGLTRTAAGPPPRLLPPELPVVCDELRGGGPDEWVAASRQIGLARGRVLKVQATGVAAHDRGGVVAVRETERVAQLMSGHLEEERLCRRLAAGGWLAQGNLHGYPDDALGGRSHVGLAHDTVRSAGNETEDDLSATFLLNPGKGRYPERLYEQPVPIGNGGLDRSPNARIRNGGEVDGQREPGLRMPHKPRP